MSVASEVRVRAQVRVARRRGPNGAPLEDVLFLIEVGTSPSEVARRTRRTVGATARLLARHGHHEAARVFYALAGRERHKRLLQAAN